MKSWKAVTGCRRAALAECVAAGCGTVPDTGAQERARQCAVRGRKMLITALFAGLAVKIFCSMVFSALAQTGAVAEADGGFWGDFFAENSIPGYREYVEGFSKKYPEQVIRAGAEDCVRYEENGISEEPLVYKDYEGISGGSIYTDAGSVIEFAVFAQEEGFYDLSLEYYPMGGSRSVIERSILIDGKLPYREMARIGYDRVWKPVADADKRIDADSARCCLEEAGQGGGKFDMAEAAEWITSYAYDRERRITEPLSVYLTSGEHRVALCALEEPMLVHRIIFSNHKPVQDYRQVKRFWDAVGIRAAGAQPIRIEAESAARTSARTLCPAQNIMSSAVFPVASKNVSGIAIDGASWEEAGQWIEWEFDVEEAGYYNISMYVCQNYVKGAGVYRKITLDGATPFEEMERYGFGYRWGWRKDVLSDGEGTPYVFYLKQGQHTIRMETVAGSGDGGAASYPLTIDCIEIISAGQ